MKEAKSPTWISVKILKDNADMVADKLTYILNNWLKTGISLAWISWSPIFKVNDNTLKKTTYQLVFVLFEKLLNEQFVTGRVLLYQIYQYKVIGYEPTKRIFPFWKQNLSSNIGNILLTILLFIMIFLIWKIYNSCHAKKIYTYGDLRHQNTKG